MNPDKNRRELKTWLLNPFVYVAGWMALGIGVAVIVGAGLIGSLSHTHFDGVLDVHTGMPAPLWFYLSEGIIDWLCLSIAPWVLGMMVSRTSFRVVDLFGTQALARWPMLLIALIVLLPSYDRFLRHLVTSLQSPGAATGVSPVDVIVGCVVLLFIVLFTCYMVFLTYKSYSISCNLAGGKAIASFIGGLILAEIASKVAIVFLAGALVSGATLDAKPPGTPEEEQKVSAAVEAAVEWLERVDRQEYGESWDDSASFFRKSVSRDDWIAMIISARKPFGSLLFREVRTTSYATRLPGAPKGEYVVIQFSTSFTQKTRCIETVTPMLDVDGAWRVSGYYIK